MKYKFIKVVLYSFAFVCASELLWEYTKLWKKRLSSIKTQKQKQKQKQNQHQEILKVMFVHDSSLYFCENERFINGRHYCENDVCAIHRLFEMIYLIDNAKKSIDLAMFLFFDCNLSDALIRASKRNVPIRIIGDRRYAFEENSEMLELGEAGIAIRFHYTSRGIMHHKFCLIDSRDDIQNSNENEFESEPQKILIYGSVNWTTNGLLIHHDNVIITSNRKLINEFQKQFNSMWNYMDPDGETNNRRNLDLDTDYSINKLS